MSARLLGSSLHTTLINFFIRVFSVIIFAAMSVGQSSSFAPDFAKAKAAAGRILDLLGQTPEIDIYNEAGDKPVSDGHCLWLTIRIQTPLYPLLYYFIRALSAQTFCCIVFIYVMIEFLLFFQTNCKGDLDFCDLHFSYPTRPSSKILQGLNVSVAQGQTLALVGGSGCGKSTLIQLLERFYNTASGHVVR